MFVRICLLSVLLMGALAAPAASEDRGTTKWSQVGGWHIRVDLGKDSCYAQQGYEDGTWLRIGFNMKNRAVYFALGNDNWRSLEAGKMYPVKFVFDDQKIYDSQLAAFALGRPSRARPHRCRRRVRRRHHGKSRPAHLLRRPANGPSLAWRQP